MAQTTHKPTYVIYCSTSKIDLNLLHSVNAPDYATNWAYYFNHRAFIRDSRSMDDSTSLIIVRAQGRPYLRVVIGFALDYPHIITLNINSSQSNNTRIPHVVTSYYQVQFLILTTTENN